MYLSKEDIKNWVNSYSAPLDEIEELERFAFELGEQIKQMDFRAKNGGAAMAYSDRLNSDNNVFSALFLTAQDISETSQGNYSFINDGMAKLYSHYEGKDNLFFIVRFYKNR